MSRIIKEIKEFYKSDRFSPVLPEHYNWRHFRFRLEDMTFSKVRKGIHSASKLKAVIIEKDGLDIYHSTAAFLSPKKIGPRKRKRGFVADCLPIMHGRYIDFDPAKLSLEHMDAAKEEARKIAELIRPTMVVFTGRGFRLQDEMKGLPANIPFKGIEIGDARLEWIKHNQKVFIKVLPMCVNIDEQITWNPLCVVRVLGTANSKTGYLCTEIPLDWLSWPIEQILQHIPYATKERPVIPETVDDELPPRKMTDAAERPGQSSPIIFFIESTVVGVKGRHILILQYQNREIEWIKRRVEFVIRRYKLGEFHLLKKDEYVYAVCMETFQPRRVEKILNSAWSLNLPENHRFRMSKLPMHGLEYLGKVIGVDNDRFCSLGHVKYFSVSGLFDSFSVNMHGKEKIIMSIAVKEVV